MVGGEGKKKNTGVSRCGWGQMKKEAAREMWGARYGVLDGAGAGAGVGDGAGAGVGAGVVPWAGAGESAEGSITLPCASRSWMFWRPVEKGTAGAVALES